MMKKLLFSLLALVASTGAFAHEDGDYVYTSNARYKVTGAHLLTTGNFADGTNGWTGNDSQPVSAESWSQEAGITPAGGNALTSLGASENLGLCQAVMITPGQKYAVSFLIKGTEVANTTVTTAFINMDGTLTKADNTTDAPVVTVLSSASYKDQWSEVVAVVAADDSLTTKAGTPMLVVNIGGLPTDVSVADFSVNTVDEVYDIRIINRQIAFAQTLMEEPAFNTGDAASAKATLAETIEGIQGVIDETNLEDPTDGEGFEQQLNEDLDNYLGVNAINVNTADGNLIPGLNISELSGWSRGGQYSANYKLNLQGGNWGHLTGDDTIDELRSAIQSGYQHSATYEAFHEDFPAGKYFFTAEVRNANTTKTSWPTEPVFNLEKKVQFYIGETTFPMETISGEEYQRFYFIADIPEGGFKAGVKWPFDVDTEEAQTVSGGAFFIRSTQVRAFNTDLPASVTRVQAFKTFKAQWDAAVNGRLAVLKKQIDGNYPWGKDSLQRARDKWDPFFLAQQAKGWITEDGTDTGVASVDELNDWAKYQGVEEYSTNEETGEQTRKDYQLVRNYQWANNYVISLNKPFTDLADAIVAAKQERNKGTNLTGDRDAYKTAIETALATLNQVRSNTTDATMEADTQTLEAALAALNAATEAFMASINASVTLADIDFSNGFVEQADGTYTISGTEGEMEFTAVQLNNAVADWNFALGHNGEETGKLHVGGSSWGTVTLSQPLTSDDALTVNFDLWFGQLGKGFLNVELLNAADQRVAGFSYDCYNGNMAFNDFDDAEGKGMAFKGKEKSAHDKGAGGCLDICADGNVNNFNLIVDYKAGTVQGKMVNSSNTVDGAAVALAPVDDQNNPIEDIIITKFRVGSTTYQKANSGATGRRCWFDNLKISKTASFPDAEEDITEDPWLPVGEIDGIETVNNVKAANAAIYTINGVQVKSASKPGLYIQNGKKFVVK